MPQASWLDQLPPELVARMARLNRRAAAVRAAQAALLAQDQADAREAEASGADADALHRLASELQAALGDAGETLAAHEARLVALEQWTTEAGRVLEGMTLEPDSEMPRGEGL